MWENLVFRKHIAFSGIEFSPTRGSRAPLPILKNFKGYLQSDGYAVYRKYGEKKEVTPLACWAHARREFERTLENDKARV